MLAVQGVFPQRLVVAAGRYGVRPHGDTREGRGFDECSTQVVGSWHLGRPVENSEDLPFDRIHINEVDAVGWPVALSVVAATTRAAASCTAFTTAITGAFATSAALVATSSALVATAAVAAAAFAPGPQNHLPVAVY
jgi:hypothetical protein